MNLVNVNLNEWFLNKPIFVGCMFVGIGIGMFFGETGVGTMIGMGVGFIVDSLYSKKKNN